MMCVKGSCRSGFSLIEIMVAILIIGLLAITAGPYAWNLYKDAQKNRAASDLRGIQQGINLFKAKFGRMPKSLRELIKKPRDPKERFKWVEGGFLGKKQEIPKDPWGHRYIFKPEPDGNDPYTLYSKGPGGKEDRISVWMLD